jgi:hypothetical protein
LAGAACAAAPEAVFSAAGPAAGFDVAAEPLQVGAKFRGRLAAQVGIFFERFGENGL